MAKDTDKSTDDNAPASETPQMSRSEFIRQHPKLAPEDVIQKGVALI